VHAVCARLSKDRGHAPLVLGEGEMTMRINHTRSVPAAVRGSSMTA
jgi:hypothetical protein